ncbi:MAG: nucleotidyl transferase AbiEii/AbiGii toxin family protein [Kiloniellales bacterium]
MRPDLCRCLRRGRRRRLYQALHAGRIACCSLATFAFADLYGGKLHAALDRQHPRDFYDVKLLGHHVHILEMNLESYRLRQSKTKNKNRTA